MVELTTGNILESDTQALVNTVNLEGFMGKGIAYQFKLEYPENNIAYIEACKKKTIDIGKPFVHFEKDKYIFNFPTKGNWREKSQYSYIEKGMDSLVEQVKVLGIQSISIPPLGCGNGGLDWFKVKGILDEKLKGLPDDVKVKVYTPSKYYASKTTTAPRMNVSHLLLMILKENLKHCTKLRLQKAAYFANLYAGEEYFKFNEYKFGPYSHAIDILSRDIREYKDYYKVDTDKAVHQILNNIISDSVKQKLDRFGEPIILASGLVNNIEKEKDLEILSTIIWILKGKNRASLEVLLDEFYQWPKENISRFEKNDIEISLDKAMGLGMLEKSLVGYELNQAFF